MKLIFLGPPGTGKGTQATGIARHFHIPHISTGDMFRAAIKNETPVGLKAKAFIDKGELVPDSVTIEMVDERLHQADCAGGYLLDGFPRTIPQAEALDKILSPDCVINLEVPHDVLLARLSGRRVCDSCKGTYAKARLEDEFLCPDCGGKLIHRKDDHPETVAERMEVYRRDTEPLIEHYRAHGKLISIASVGETAHVNTKIVAALEGKA